MPSIAFDPLRWLGVWAGAFRAHVDFIPDAKLCHSPADPCSSQLGMAVAHGGKSPVELAFGCRPRDVANTETQDLEQLTPQGPGGDQCEESVQRFASPGF